MKYLLTLSLVGLMSAGLMAQQKGSLGQYFNQPTQFYSKLNPTSSTANDTSGFITLKGGQGGIAIYGSADDSCSALVYYRLRQSRVGGYAVTGSWTAIDTLGQAGDGTLSTISGAGQLVGTVALATLLGYDEIQFYVDYLTGTSNAAADGTSNTVRLFYYYLKPDAVR